VKTYAIKKSLVDIPNDRSSHTIPTPHGGGIAIAITWFIGISYLFLNNEINSALYYALIVGIIISVVSYIDDLFELSAKSRIIVQSLVAFLGLYFLGGLETIDLKLLSVDNQIITNIVAFFMIVWFINLYNFLDGIDGYAGTEALFLGVAGFILFSANYFLVLVVAVLGFLIWNFPSFINRYKAKIFMGDVGSTLLGYNVAIFTIYYANNDISIFVWLILFGLFWFDATLTLIRRYKNGEKLSVAHKKHAYQRLIQSGFSHNKVVRLSILVNMVLFLLVYFISNIIVVFLIMFVILYLIVNYIDKRKGFF
jgi:Fuc2NAc and GlcNAc transferase